MTAIDTGSSTLVANYTEYAHAEDVIAALEGGPVTAATVADVTGHPLRAVLNTLNALNDPGNLLWFLSGVNVRRVVPNREDGEAMAARWVIA